MDDAAALVAIVGGGEVTPIHLIMCRKKEFSTLAHCCERTLSRVRLPGWVFHSPVARSLVEATLIKNDALQPEYLD